MSFLQPAPKNAICRAASLASIIIHTPAAVSSKNLLKCVVNLCVFVVSFAKSGCSISDRDVEGGNFK